MENKTIAELEQIGFNNLNSMEIKNLWFDWFCRDTSLTNKGRYLLLRLKSILRSKKFDNNTTYVFFKNNCPCVGHLYDDFRICDKETGDVLYTVVPRSGYDSDDNEAQVFGRENNFQEPLAHGKWKDIKRFFLVEDEK